jgi:uncharacterized protein (TIGR04255 family)
MATRGRPIPKKLKDDAIVEAIFEIRFDSTTIPEILFGRLADYSPWKTFEQRQLPAYVIPAPVRQADANLRYQPVFELVEATRQQAVRIGPQVLSYHRLSPYVGWVKFRSDLEEAIVGLFAKADGLSIRRLGLRYMNALRPDLHGIRSISDLDLSVEIAGEKISGNVNVNFTTHASADTSSTVRIATPDFVQGALPASTSIYVDVDVFTKDTFRTSDQQVVKNWIKTAHDKEKADFFGLLTDSTIEALKED